MNSFSRLALFSSCLLFTACSVLGTAGLQDRCKIQTYIEESPIDYLNSRFPKAPPLRLGVIPFDVQESFARPGNSSQLYGTDLSQRFLLELQKPAVIPIVEFFNRDRWPGKREEFFQGNQGALKMAREAGYDAIFVGQLEEIKNDRDLVLHTKVIDVPRGITIWSARTTLTSFRRAERKFMGALSWASENFHDRPELFDFPERAEELAVCTVHRFVSGPEASLDLPSMPLIER